MKHAKGVDIPTIYIEGNVGVGKSTFLDFVKKHMDVQVIYEPNELWQNIDGYDLLKEFFVDQKRWAYTLQSYVLLTRVDQLLQADKQDGQHAVRIVERSIYSGRYCFAQVACEVGTMNDLECCLYKKLWQKESVKIQQQHVGFIYLRTGAEICYQRIMSRARFEEKPISMSYLKALEVKHDNWFIDKKGVDEYILSRPQLILDNSSDLLTDKNMQKHYVEALQEFIEKVQTFNSNT